MLEKYSTLEFCKRVQWEPICSMERTDRHGEANSRSSQCLECA